MAIVLTSSVLEYPIPKPPGSPHTCPTIPSFYHTSQPSLQKTVDNSLPSHPHLLSTSWSIYHDICSHYSTKMALVKVYQCTIYQWCKSLLVSFAGVTYHHKFNDLKQCQFIFLYFWRSKLQNG